MKNTAAYIAVPVHKLACHRLGGPSIHLFTLNVCCSRKSQKNTKTYILRVQGHSRSSMLTPLKSSSLVIVMINSMSVPMRNRFHAAQVNSGKIKTF